MALADSFAGVFRLGLVPILPAIVIMVLSLFRVQVRKAMFASIVTAIGVCLFWQHTDPSGLFALLINGYHAPDPSLSSMIDGGGIMSMVRVALIITISSSYSGIFEETGLLNGLKSKMGTLSRRFSVFGTILGTAAAARYGGLQSDTGDDAGRSDLQGTGAGRSEICDRYGKFCDRSRTVSSMVDCWCSSSGIRVSTAYIDCGSSLFVSASAMVFWRET